MSETFPFEPEGIRLGVVRGISYGLFGPPGEFVPQARALGAGLVRAYLYWSQVEPEPGQYRWDTGAALRGQLTGEEELWITLWSSSPWGTRQPTEFLPPSPALDQGEYAQVARPRVRHRLQRAGARRLRARREELADDSLDRAVGVGRHLVDEADPQRGQRVESLACHEVAPRRARPDLRQREG